MENRAILEGVLVLELASVLAGPSVGMFLAELGARVLKVENFRIGGDVTRTWKLRSESPETDRSAYFSSVNWGKESLGLDLSLPQGRELVYQLVRQADIVVASYKPGDAVKLGMDAGTLRALNPRLIYAELTAYGGDDPRTGFDAIIQAEAGFTAMNGEPEGQAVKMPVALMDLLAAHQLKEGVLLAWIHRLRSGEGAHIQASLIGAGVASLANQATNWLVGGAVPGRLGSEHPNIVPYGTQYPTQDGREIVLAVGNDGQFTRLCDCLELTPLATDPRFSTNPARVQHRAELNALLRTAISRHDRDTLLAALAQAKVPAGALHSLPEVFEMPAAREMLLHGGGFTGVRTLALTEDFTKRPRALSPPPPLASGTAAALSALLNLSPADLDALETAGVISRG